MAKKTVAKKAKKKGSSRTMAKEKAGKGKTQKKTAPKRSQGKVKRISPISTKKREAIAPKQPDKQPSPSVQVSRAKVTDDEMAIRLFAALSYCLVLLIIPVLMKKGNPFVNWHIKQGVVMLIITAVMIVVMPLINVIPIAGPLVVLGLGLLWIALFIWAIVSALLGQQWRFPLIGGMASKMRI